MVETFRKVTSEIAQIIPRLSGTRWKKKSDFYMMFLELAARKDRIPFDDAKLQEISARLSAFGGLVDSLLSLEEKEWESHDSNVIS